MLDAPVSRYRRLLKIRDLVWEIKYWDLRALNNVKSNFPFNETNKKDAPAIYSTVFWCLIVVLLIFLAFLHNHCYSLHKTKWRLVISIRQGPGPTRMPYFRRNSNPLQFFLAPGQEGNLFFLFGRSAWKTFKISPSNRAICAGLRGTYGFRPVPVTTRLLANLHLKLETSPGWELALTICCDVDLNFGENTTFLLRLVQDPARSKWPALTSSYEGSNSGYAIKPSKKPIKQQSDTITQWNTSQVRPIYSFHWREN